MVKNKKIIKQVTSNVSNFYGKEDVKKLSYHQKVQYIGQRAQGKSHLVALDYIGVKTFQRPSSEDADVAKFLRIPVKELRRRRK